MTKGKVIEKCSDILGGDYYCGKVKCTRATCDKAKMTKVARKRLIKQVKHVCKMIGSGADHDKCKAKLELIKKS